MLSYLVASALALVCLSVPSAIAQPKPSANTTYNSDGDYFHTKGQVTVNVPYTTLGKIAADFPRYREWGLHEINKNKNGKKFSIIFRDVVYLPGGRGGKGIFRIFFDLDWPWPLGDKNKQLDFAILEAEPNGKGGIKRLLIDIEKKGALLKTFRLDLKAFGNTQSSKVTFQSKVKFNGFVDTFFSLARFRENIEYRIIKVIQNLQREAEQGAVAHSKPDKKLKGSPKDGATKKSGTPPSDKAADNNDKSNTAEPAAEQPGKETTTPDAETKTSPESKASENPDKSDKKKSDDTADTKTQTSATSVQSDSIKNPSKEETDSELVE